MLGERRSENDQLRRAAHERRLAALAALLADYEADYGTISPEEMSAAVRLARRRAVVIRP